MARRNGIIRGVATTLIGLQLNMLAMGAWADGALNSAGQAQSLGLQMRQAFSQDSAQITFRDIYPDQNNSTSDLQGVFGKDTETNNLGTDAQNRLTAEPSMEGEAYRTLRDSGRRISPDLRNDPMFNTADNVRNPDFMAGFRETFSDCETRDIFEDVTRTTRIQQNRTCERILDSSGTHTLVHDYTVGIIEYVGGQQNIQSCGVGCLYVWVGTVGDNYWSGNCTIYEEFTRFRILSPESITSATVVNAAFDDYFQILFNDDMVWTHTPGIFPPETGGACERNTNWRVNVNQDITGILKNNSEDVITFKTRTSVTGAGEGYARIRILFDPAKAFVDRGWGDEEALTAVQQINDGFCSNVSVQCTSRPALDANGCFTENGVTVCESNFLPSPHPAINRSCRQAQISADCGFYRGAMDCYTDAQGVQQCPVNEGGQLDSCSQYEQDPNCGFITQRCISGAEGSEGGCYAFEEVWDCGYDVEVSDVVNTGAQIECPGEAQCMGSECFDTSNAQSSDFGYAAAMLQIAQFAEHDLDCGDYEDTQTANECRVFKGEAMECKKALGGYVDCCEAPSGVSVFDYVRLTMSSLKMASSVEAMNRTGSFFSPGYWQGAKAAGGSVANSVTSGSWSGAVDAATGAFQDTVGGVAQETLISQFQEKMMKYAYDAMMEMGAESAANAMFQQGATEGGMQLSSQAATALNFIGAVYTAYVIADLMINIIWECEAKEFELGAKKETRQCSYVGSYCASEVLGSCVEKREAYCCFGSVVGRIIQEQGRPQLGMGFGSSKSPSCDGLTASQLQAIDWNRVDLSEWVGMLSMTGYLPTPDSVSLENLTGSGSSLSGFINDEEGRLNTLDRNVERLEGVDVDDIKRETEQERMMDLINW